MKKMKYAVLALAAMIGVCAMPAQVKAEEYVNIKSYTETFTPAEGTDAQLDVTVTGTAGDDGYLYLIASWKPTNPDTQKAEVAMDVKEVTGENLDGTELEAYKEGSTDYFRIKVADTSAEATVNVQFICKGFYSDARSAEDNGAEDYTISHKFTNYLPTKISSYKAMVYLPEGYEVVKVSSPAKYADYILDEADGLRGAGLSKGLAPAAANTLTFTYDASQSTIANVLVWAVCLGIGIVVFVDRFKKANKE